MKRLYKTNLRCSSCLESLKPIIDQEPGITHWEVELDSPDKVLTVEGSSFTDEQIQSALKRAGYNILGAVTASPSVSATGLAEPSPTTYYPLMLILAFLLGTVALVEIHAGAFSWERSMRHFMAGFFLVFAFFKLLDIRGFADSYRMYDVVAKRLPVYGYVYPFIELLLGAAYLVDFRPWLTNAVTLVVMSISAVGVLQSVLAKRKIRCACLGTVFNLPMSTVTLVEDGLMIVMAAAMLLSGSHPSLHANNPDHSSFMKGNQNMQTHLKHHHHSSSHSHHAPVATKGGRLVDANSELRQPGESSELHFNIRDAKGGMVRNFTLLHEEKVHLIIVRDGLDTFAHLHPSVDDQGNIAIAYTFPEAGTYHLFADYHASGQEPDTVRTTIKIPGSSADALPLKITAPGRIKSKQLQAELTISKLQDMFSYNLRFNLLDQNALPLQNLQPYLGAMGHLVIISSDSKEYVHAHPVDQASTFDSNVVQFHAQFPHARLYKGWGQFQWNNQIHTLPFVMHVQ